MNEIDMGLRADVVPYRRRWLGRLDRVPADVRHLHRVALKPAHRPAKMREARDPGRFLARFKEELIAQADPEKRPLLAQPCGDRLPKSPGAQLRRAIAERPHAR